MFKRQAQFGLGLAHSHARQHTHTRTHAHKRTQAHKRTHHHMHACTRAHLHTYIEADGNERWKHADESKDDANNQRLHIRVPNNARATYLQLWTKPNSMSRESLSKYCQLPRGKGEGYSKHSHHGRLFRTWLRLPAPCLFQNPGTLSQGDEQLDMSKSSCSHNTGQKTHTHIHTHTHTQAHTSARTHTHTQVHKGSGTDVHATRIAR